MPIYEYWCPKCEQRKEVLMLTKHPQYIRCPNCDMDMSRVLSAPAVHFRGEGWTKRSGS